MKLGNKILELRKKKGLSQEDLGELVGVTRQTISNWELGETSPNPEQLKALSKELNISIDELLDNDTKSILIEKTSNTERLAGLILKLIRFAVIFIILVPILLIITRIIFKNINEKNSGRLINTSIVCKLHDETYSYEFNYYENTNQIKEAGGDGYLANITGIDKVEYAYEALDIIDAYVKNNGGTCKRIENLDLNDIVDMTIKEGSLTKTEATIIIKESVDYDIIYGEPFWLEKYNTKTNSFEVLENSTGNNCAFNLPAYSATPDKPLELTQNWSCMYGNLSKGTYKLVKNVSFESDEIVTDKDIYYIWVEFEID